MGHACKGQQLSGQRPESRPNAHVFSAVALGYSHYLQYKGLKLAKCSSFLRFPSLLQEPLLSTALLHADP